jgi:peroxiredoxin
MTREEMNVQKTKAVGRTWLGITVALWLLPAAAIGVTAGNPAPDFTLRSSTGKNIRLQELRGEVVMVNFWATWCGPCREEMPALNRLHEKYRTAGFTLLGVNIDDKPDNAMQLAKRLKVGYPLLHDADKRASRHYDVSAMPMTFLIDRNGRMRFAHRGYVPGYEDRYEAQIRQLLKE